MLKNDHQLVEIGGKIKDNKTNFFGALKNRKKFE